MKRKTRLSEPPQIFKNLNGFEYAVTLAKSCIKHFGYQFRLILSAKNRYEQPTKSKCSFSDVFLTTTFFSSYTIKVTHKSTYQKEGL